MPSLILIEDMATKYWDKKSQTVETIEQTQSKAVQILQFQKSLRRSLTTSKKNLKTINLKKIL